LANNDDKIDFLVSEIEVSWFIIKYLFLDSKYKDLNTIRTSSDIDSREKAYCCIKISR
jgi:hypothetical protein